MPISAKPGSAFAAALLAVTEFLAFVTFVMATDSSSGLSRIAITLAICLARTAARNLGFHGLALSGRTT
jgi:hypothetical protein